MYIQPLKILKTLVYVFGCFSGSMDLILSFKFSPLPTRLQAVENITFHCMLMYDEYNAVSKG